MMDFSLRDRDLEITNGDFALCQSETHAIAQAITIRLRTLAGEWFLDTRAGIPYLSHILGRKQSERLLRKLISEAIKSLPSIITIKEFVVKTGPGERSMNIGFKAILQVWSCSLHSTNLSGALCSRRYPRCDFNSV